VVLPSGNEQQRCALVVAEVDTSCGVWVEIRQGGLEEDPPGARDGFSPASGPNAPYTSASALFLPIARYYLLLGAAASAVRITSVTVCGWTP
jgi:hypothetical protein